MLKELNYWLTRGDQIKTGSSPQIHAELPKDIFELRGSDGNKFSDSEEDQIAICQLINA